MTLNDRFGDSVEVRAVWSMHRWVVVTVCDVCRSTMLLAPSVSLIAVRADEGADGQVRQRWGVASASQLPYALAMARN